MYFMIKPKRVAYNEKNQWYTNVVMEVFKMSIEAVTDVLPKVAPSMISAFFTSFIYLMKIFITLNCSFGHFFFAQIMKCYTLNKGCTEKSIMKIFAEMLSKGYSNEEEKHIIMQASISILTESSLYENASGDAFLIFYYLAKIDQNVYKTFLKTAVDLFIQTKNDPSKFACRCSYSLFIFSSFNADPNVFGCIAPILPQIFELFPMRQMTIINLFVDELVTLINGRQEILTKEFTEMIISAILRYISFQAYASIIMKLSEDKHIKLLNALNILIQRHIQQFPGFDIRSFVASCLPGHEDSIQYILQIFLSQK